MRRVLRPDAAEVRTVAGFVGRVLIVAGLIQTPAIVLALLLGQLNDASAMAVGATIPVLVGRRASRMAPANAELRWSTGTVTVALAWLLVPVALGVSIYLTGATGSYVDALFDGMSGLTTSGLSLIQDVDHLGSGVQLLRHITHFAGGQGIILVVLTILTVSGGQVGTLLVSEGRDERIVPNVIRTARLIYLIATAWAIAGTAALWVALTATGFTPGRALAHASNLFMAAFDTGGFSMMSTSVAYYHSGWVELVLAVLMVAGGISFPMHYWLWQRQAGKALRHLDLRTFVVSTGLLTFGLLLAMAAHHVQRTTFGLLRKGAFTALSAATGTGFTVVAPTAYLQWGQLAPAMVVTIMAIGAMSGSTAGGIKTLRLGLLVKSVVRDVRKALAPSSEVVVASYQGRNRVVVTDTQVRGAVVVVVLFLATYMLGAIVGVFHGATLEAAMFESVSATAAVGLSAGLTTPSAPITYKLTLITQMWMGRLEVLAALALFGWCASIAGRAMEDSRRGAVRLSRRVRTRMVR